MSRGDKASGYVAQLYDARCSGNSSSVRELARKVEKSVPGRKLLVLAANAGASIWPTPVPGRFYSVEQDYGAKLTAALEAANVESAEDALDAAVVRSALLLGLKRHDLVAQFLPRPLLPAEAPQRGTGAEGWRAVCIVQGTLLQGIAQEAAGQTEAASQTYRSAISYIANIVLLASAGSELLRWTEELLCHMCVFFSTHRRERPAQLGEAMAAFHLLSSYQDSQRWLSLSGSRAFSPHGARAVWRGYYEALSRVVREDLVYHPSPAHTTLEHRGLLDDEDFFASRVQQRADLRRVEANYEQLLLAETVFPKAGETNTEVKNWIDLVMSNWRVLCGPTWSDQELGAGGKVVILYRAATKTFHSTQILRSLFSVHAFLGEFDLALKAFDSYAEIMTRGKARAEKSGSADLDLDDDDTAIKLAAEVIRVICRYGPPSAAEQAFEVGEKLEGWLKKGTTISSDLHLRNSEGEDNASGLPRESQLSEDVLLIAYSAIGVSQAHYARHTTSPSLRAALQEKAISNLRRAATSTTEHPTHIEAKFALALTLAETRETSAAIDIVREILNQSGGADALANTDGVISIRSTTRSGVSALDIFTHHRKLLPVWHLLAQLLSAREDFAMAQSCCDVLLEQYNSTAELLTQNAKVHRRSKSSTPFSKLAARFDAAIAQLEDYDKQGLIEAQMSRISLIELTDGPEAAVNASSELFGQYARVYGSLESDGFKGQTQLPATPIKTHGSIRSIFGRSRPGTVRSMYGASGPPSRPATSGTLAPSLRPTAINGNNGSVRSSMDGTPNRNSSVLRKKSGDLRRRDPTTLSGTAQNSIRPSLEIRDGNPSPGGSRLQETGPNMNSTSAPPPLQQARQPPEQDTRLPVVAPAEGPSPAPQFVKLQTYRHKSGILAKIWLFVARLYVNATLFDEANSAVAEASKIVAEVESAVAQEGVSVKAFRSRGWGGWKSIEELWADVCCERGRLLVAQSLPHDAFAQFERALLHDINHAEATVTLSSLLLDIYDETMPAQRPDPGSISATLQSVDASPQTADRRVQSDSRALNRIASRDRAYALLSTLAKIGGGWDEGSVFYQLARAHELSGQDEKARDALWWCVHLEDTRPLRSWASVNPGGFVL